LRGFRLFSLWIYTMNRCLQALPRRLALLALLFGLALSASAQAPQRIPPIPAHAQRGLLEITAPPEVLLGGQAARLSPGARIRGHNNLLVMSGALLGQPLPVRYVRDPQGLLHEVWLLTEAELRAEQEH
jgi:hypothetical protein